jgi:hypothetical protein
MCDRARPHALYDEARIVSPQDILFEKGSLMRLSLWTMLTFAVVIALAGLGGKASLGRASQPSKDVQSFANDSLEASDLADFLGIAAWTFHFEGGVPESWVEVIEDGQKTVSKSKILESREVNTVKEAQRGKILLFVRRGGIELRIHSGVSSGGAGIGLSPDALWWGWNSASGSTERLQQPLSPKAAEEVTLLKHTMLENAADAKDLKHPRKVVMTLKARLVRH